VQKSPPRASGHPPISQTTTPTVAVCLHPQRLILYYGVMRLSCPMHGRLTDARAPVGATPRAAQGLDQPLVLWRDATSQPHALPNRCAHRGALLSRGTVVDGTLACRYHGWRDAGTGKCVHIPGSYPLPTKKERRSPGQGAQKPLDPQRPAHKMGPSGTYQHALSRPMRVACRPIPGRYDVPCSHFSSCGVQSRSA